MQELQLPARLVEDVGHAVAALGHAQGAVAQGRAEAGRRRGLGALEGAQQLVGGDAAVDDVLAVVARVVPAAADVEPVVADARLAGHVGVTLVGRHAEVAGRAGVLRADQRAVDGDAAALDVEELQRVRAQLVVDRRRDVERVAGLAVGHEGEARAPRRRTRRSRWCARSGRRPASTPRGVAVAARPRRCRRCSRSCQGSARGGVGDEGGVLRAVRQVADLVDPHPRARCRARRAVPPRRRAARRCPGRACSRPALAADLERDLGPLGVSPRGEGELEVVGRPGSAGRRWPK